MTATRRAVALLSGGMDSATAAALVRDGGYDVHALAVDYGQRHALELEAARRVADALGLASFRVVRVDLASLGGSALTDDLAVPKDRREADIGDDIPVTYVPARNTVVLAIALAAAEVLDADVIAIGVNALDYSGYPDCRPAFLEAFRGVSAQGTKRGVEGRPIEVLAPLLEMTKADIVRAAAAHDVPLGLTVSCYDPAPEGRPCGRCDACRLRARGFAEAGLVDPATS